MVLSDRKKTILKAIIRNYLDTGEPVGSRTISKYTDLNLSSATIRNEMADLEELGYIVQPHTSAGRVPSDKGYRLYVDTLMEEREQEVQEMRDQLLQKADRMEQILKQAARLLAVNTNYASMVAAPTYHKTKLKFMQLSQISERQLLVVIVAEGNVVRNKVLQLSEPLDNETILKLNILLNSNLNGMAMEEINLGLIARLKEQAGIHSEVISDILDAIAESIQVEEMEIYTSGATNILKYPELASHHTAGRLLETFEEKERLARFLEQEITQEESTEIRVHIGSEMTAEEMEECSVVTATYRLGDGLTGTIGIVGPKRMDYENVVHSLRTLKRELDALYNKGGN